MWNPFKKKIESPEGPVNPKLSKPKDLPAPVGRDLVVKMKKDPSWVWKLKCVTRECQDRKNRVEVRVFDPEEAAKVNAVIAHYNSLENNPDLILFEGWLDAKTHEAELRTAGRQG